MRCWEKPTLPTREETRTAGGSLPPAAAQGLGCAGRGGLFPPPAAHTRHRTPPVLVLPGIWSASGSPSRTQPPRHLFGIALSGCCLPVEQHRRALNTFGAGCSRLSTSCHAPADVPGLHDGQIKLIIGFTFQRPRGGQARGPLTHECLTVRYTARSSTSWGLLQAVRYAHDTLHIPILTPDRETYSSSSLRNL